ncbi:amphi-Trp domain-containing protein [Halobiforma lacisalsi AJ5]|uniref:Amphi-Trp domain-containing protein n=1 Tax=Natronobacterium lacisalsi AJ5 TaxID=358396 RepID=M0LPQ6_NATLA|nr:amphi-Trp domain-containing protein [Halobiforma lacisalsi]APW99676.1 amphi-Trp domain-containing protein [Halobiforma lacisalsi AJ5]EMA35532.1 hypothetical protein C445_04848 [Halobiforma lacisalsi AJ5]
MSETTSYEEEVPREEAADLLQALASEVRGDSGDIAEVQVGNKTLTLRPGATVEYGIEIEERSPMLGGDREEITVTIGWEASEAE